MSKLIKDGRVAVIVSGGFGAGWSTWGASESCLDGELAQAILDKKPISEIEEIAEKNWPHQYQGGLFKAHVSWVNQGSAFEIEEYDGSESLHIIGERNYLVA